MHSETGGKRPGSSRYFTIRKSPATKRLGLHLGLFLVTVALLAYLGPFGTWDALSIPDRLVFWSTTVGANWLFGSIALSVTARAFRARGWPLWVGLVPACLLAALPGTGTVWLAVALYLDHRPSDVSGVVELCAQVAVLHLIIGAIAFHLIDRARQQQEAGTESSPPDDARGKDTETAATGTVPGAALLARLPERSRAELLHLRMQDHYLEVHTAAGMVMLLLRFRDALREVQGVNGLRVHRSHWVSRAAVAAVERRRDGRISLRLVNGSTVPVSRSFAPELKARGWL